MPGPCWELTQNALESPDLRAQTSARTTDLSASARVLQQTASFLTLSPRRQTTQVLRRNCPPVLPAPELRTHSHTPDTACNILS